MRGLALAVLVFFGMCGCAPRSVPPDELALPDEAIRAAIEAHSEEIARNGFAFDAAGLERTLQRIADDNGARSVAYCQALTDAGVMLISIKETGPAVRFFERAVTACEAAHGHEHRETSYSLHDYGEAQVRAARGRYEPQARQWFEEALAVRRRVLGMAHVDTAAAEISLGRHILVGCQAEPPCTGTDGRLERALGLARRSDARRFLLPALPRRSGPAGVVSERCR